jgi:hypothetical protein
MRAGKLRLKCFHLMLPAGSEREVFVPVIFSSVPDLDVEMPRYKDAAPFPVCASAQSLSTAE